MKALQPTVATLLALTCACAHSAATGALPAPAAPSATDAPQELWCGPVACPKWLSSEIASSGLPLRERCTLLSKVLMFQPLTLAGRPLSAFEASQRTGVGRIEQSVAVAVSVREPEQALERSLFAAGETCGAALLVLAPSPTHGDAEDASSIFRLSLTPEKDSSGFAFVLSAEPVSPSKPMAAPDAWKPLQGHVVRGAANAGPDSWTVVVHATVDSADALKD